MCKGPQSCMTLFRVPWSSVYELLFKGLKTSTCRLDIDKFTSLLMQRFKLLNSLVFNGKELERSSLRTDAVQLFLHFCIHLLVLEPWSCAEPAHKPTWQGFAAG